MSETNNVGNETQQVNDEVKSRFEKANSKVQIKIGEKFVDADYTVYDDGEIVAKVPEGVDSEQFQEAFSSISPEALKNKAGFTKNQKLKEQEKRIKELEEKLISESNKTPTKAVPDDSNDLDISPEDFGLETQEELEELIETDPVKYSKDLPKIMSRKFDAKIGKLTESQKVQQQDMVLRNQASVDKLSYDAYLSWVKEVGWSKGSQSYSTFRNMELLKKGKAIDLSERQQSRVSFETTASPIHSNTQSQKVNFDFDKFE